MFLPALRFTAVSKLPPYMDHIISGSTATFIFAQLLNFLTMAVDTNYINHSKPGLYNCGP